MEAPLKVCKDCGQSFPATTEYFQFEPKTKCGLKPRCIPCYRADHAKQMQSWRDNNAEQSSTYQKQWRNDNRARYQQSDRNRYKRDTEKRKQWQRDYRITHPDRVKHSADKSRKTPLGRAKSKALLLRYHDTKNDLPNDFTADDWLKCLTYFNHRCAVCNRPIGFWHTIAADHWIPISSKQCPGTVKTNIVPLCHGVSGCNNRKQDKDAFTWLCEMYGKHKALKIFNRIEAYFHSIKSNPE